MSAIARLPAPPTGPPEEDHFVQLRGVSWADYERVLAMRGDRSAPRITYDDGVLEIMSPSINHESVKSNIGCLVEIWLDYHGVEHSKLGSWTLKKEADKKGARDDGYVESPHSEVLEGVDLALLASFIDRVSTSAAKREYRAALGS